MILQVLSVAREEQIVGFNVDFWNHILDLIFYGDLTSSLVTTRTKDGEQKQNDGSEEIKREEEEKHNFLNNVASVLGLKIEQQHEKKDIILSILFHACHHCCTNNKHRNSTTSKQNNEEEAKEQEPMLVDAFILIQAWYDTLCLCYILENQAEEVEAETTRKLLLKCYPTKNPRSDLSFLIQSLSSFYDEHDISSSEKGKAVRDVTLIHFCSWSKEIMPLLHKPITTFMRENIFFFPSSSSINEKEAVTEVTMKMNKKSFILGGYTLSPRACALSCMSSHFSGKWHRLYASDHDGLSFQSLQHSLLGYAGPTLLLIRSTSSTNNDGNSIIGAYTSTPIRNSGDTYFGDDDCFLFRLCPDIRMYRPSNNSNRRFVFFRGIPTGKVRSDLSLHGWGFGGVARSPRLFVRGTFDDCTAAVRDTTYDHGPLLSTEDITNSTVRFDIESLEVWGVGADNIIEKALHLYGGYRQTADAALEKARTVDKAQFMADFKSGLFESNFFAHRQQMQMGRGECLLDGCVNDDEDWSSDEGDS
uniref:Oxidation resistance protein 1 n=1 Tax=Ditylum brightwellii TaxID=49249 RepID=A0A7S2ELJ7_9STRA